MQVNYSSASYSNSWVSASVDKGRTHFKSIGEDNFVQADDEVSQKSLSHAFSKQDAIEVKIGNPQGGSRAIEYGNQNSDSQIDKTSKDENSDTENKPSSSLTRKFDELSQAEKQLVNELQQRDTEVKTHEMAHLSVAGNLATSGPTYDYQRGPDGKKYAIGGEVHIDSSPVPGDPEETVRKMEQVKRAALAPAEPSAQDRRVAAKASATAAKARVEIFQIQSEVKAQDKKSLASKNSQQRTDLYINSSYFPRDNARTFSIAV